MVKSFLDLRNSKIQFKGYFDDEYVKTIKEIGTYIPKTVRHVYYPRGGDDILWLNLNRKLFLEDIYGSLKDCHPEQRKDKELPKIIKEFLPEIINDNYVPSNSEINILKGNCDGSNMARASNRNDFCLIYKPFDFAAPGLLKKLKNMPLRYGAIITTGKSDDLDKYMLEMGYDQKKIILKHEGTHSMKSNDGTKELRSIVPKIMTVYVNKIVTKPKALFEIPSNYIDRNSVFISQNLFDGKNEYLLDNKEKIYVKDTP